MATLPIARGGGCHGNRRPSTRMRQGPREGGRGCAPAPSITRPTRGAPHPPRGRTAHGAATGAQSRPGMGHRPHVGSTWHSLWHQSSARHGSEPSRLRGCSPRSATHHAVLLATECSRGERGRVPYGGCAPRSAPGLHVLCCTREPGGGRRGGAGNSSCVLAQGDGQWSPAQPPAPGGSFVQEIISCSESLTLTAALLAHLPAAGRGDVQGRARCCPTERLCGCVCAPCPPPPRPPTELWSQRPSLWAQHGHGATLWHTQSLRHGAEHRSGRGAMAWRGWLLPGVAAEGPWSHGDWSRRARSAGGAVGAEQRHRAWRPRVGAGWGHHWTAPKPPAGRDGSDGDGGSWDNPEYKIPPCPTPV